MSTYEQAMAILQRTDPAAALRPQPASDWTGDYPLPAAVAAYYAELGPDDLSIRGYGNAYILRAYHGEGSWRPEELFRDLAEMVTALAILGEIRTVVGRFLTDEDGLIQAHHLAEAAARLTPGAGSPERAVALGWQPTG